jgi:hypothetical protein
MKCTIFAATFAALSFAGTTCLASSDTLVQGALFIHQTPLHGGQAVDITAFFMQNDTVFFCNLNQHVQSVELDHNLWSSKTLGGSGGLVLWSRDARHIDVGLIQCFSLKMWGGTLAGYGEVLRSASNGKIYWSSPNNRLMWAVDKRWNAGVGFSYTGAQGTPNNLLIGPAVQLNTKMFGDFTSIRLRVGQWVTGVSSGQKQARLDWFVKF